MIHEIIQIDGRVRFKITLDPSIWIFDDRRFPIQKVFPQVEEQGECMYLGIFLNNAEPLEDATAVIVYRRSEDQVIIPLEVAQKAILRFSREKRALREDGPAWLYFADGSNVDNPIRSITRLELI